MTDAPLPALSRASLTSIAAITCIQVLSIGAIAPALPLLAARWGIGAALTGAVLSSFAAGRVSATVIAGRIADTRPIHHVATGALLIGAVTSLASLRGDVLSVAAGQFVGGLASITFTTAAFALVAASVPVEQRGRAISTYQAIAITAVSIGPLLGGFAVQHLGPTGPFVVALAANLTGLFVVPFLPSHTPSNSASTAAEETAASRVTTRGVLHSSEIRLALLLSFTVSWTMSGPINTVLPLLTFERLNDTGLKAGVLLTMAAIVSVGALLIAGRRIDHYGRRGVIRIGAVAMGAAVMLLAFASTFATVLGVVVAYGVAKGALTPTPSVVVTDVTPLRATGTALGLMQGAFSAGLLAGPFMSGFLVDHIGTTGALSSCGLLIIVVSVILRRLPETLGWLGRPTVGLTAE